MAKTNEMTHDSRKDFEEKRKFGEAYDFIRGITLILGVTPIAFAVLCFLFGDSVFGSNSAPQYNSILDIPWSPESWGTFSGVCGVIILVGFFRNKHRQVGSGCVLMGAFNFALAYFVLKDCLKYDTSFGSLAIMFFLALGIIYLDRARLGYNWRR